MEGGHYDKSMIISIDPNYTKLSDKVKEEILIIMNLLHMSNDKEDIIMSDKHIYDVAHSIVVDRNIIKYPSSKDAVETKNVGTKAVETKLNTVSGGRACKKDVKKQCAGCDCGMKGGASYISVSVDIGKKLVKDFKIDYRPAAMAKMLSEYRKGSKAKTAVDQLKDADKAIRADKANFIKKYNNAIKAMEKKKK